MCVAQSTIVVVGHSPSVACLRRAAVVLQYKMLSGDPPGSLSSILRVVCPAAHQYFNARHARPCLLPLPVPRSCSALLLLHILLFLKYTSHIPFLSLPIAPVHSVKAAASPKSNTQAIHLIPDCRRCDAAKAAADTAEATENAAKAKTDICDDTSTVMNRGKAQARACSQLEMTAAQSGCRTALGHALITFCSGRLVSGLQGAFVTLIFQNVCHL